MLCILYKTLFLSGMGRTRLPGSARKQSVEPPGGQQAQQLGHNTQLPRNHAVTRARLDHLESLVGKVLRAQQDQTLEITRPFFKAPACLSHARAIA